MNKNKKIFIVALLVFILLNLVQVTNAININIENFTDVEEPELRVIRIAQYPRESGSDGSFENIFNYTWFSSSKTYRFQIKELTLEELKGRGKKPLSTTNYDILVVGASFDSVVKDANDKDLLENIRNFVYAGGGYIGVCAGAFFASQGYENNQKIVNKYANDNVLKIANVYTNWEIDEEGQYIWKLGEYTYNPEHGMVPLEMRINKTSSNPIFNCYKKPTINITYGGGPGLYPTNINDSTYGEIDPVLIINEELMETKPIHIYKKRLIGWEQGEVVRTDMLGQYGGISTTYGAGRVVIFSVHPEIRSTLNGTIGEYIGHTTGFGIGIKPIRGVYAYFGEHENVSCNYWIHRRAAAWIAGLPEEDMPPYNELMVDITKPCGFELFINDKAIYNKLIGKLLDKFLYTIGSTVIINDFTFEVFGENCSKVEFYLDDELVKTEETNDIGFYSLSISGLEGCHKISVKGYDSLDNFASMERKCLFKNLKK